jgi:hypothetical protein
VHSKLVNDVSYNSLCCAVSARFRRLFVRRSYNQEISSYVQMHRCQLVIRWNDCIRNFKCCWIAHHTTDLPGFHVMKYIQNRPPSTPPCWLMCDMSPRSHICLSGLCRLIAHLNFCFMLPIKVYHALQLVL